MAAAERVLRSLRRPDRAARRRLETRLSRLPRLKSGVDPRLAFAGTFHANESFSQLEAAYAEARGGEMPRTLPLEMYCHTLTDPTILSAELIEKGFHTLNLFGLHTPAQLFDANPERAKELAKERAIASLNQYLLDPIESVLAPCRDGSLAIEVKSPLDLEKDVFLPRGNIFHRDLDFPEWFGGNLDALHDCLTDFSWHPAPGYVITLTGSESLRSNPTSFAAFNQVLASAVEAWQARNIPLRVFYLHDDPPPAIGRDSSTGKS